MEECDPVFRTKHKFNENSISKKGRQSLSPDGKHSCFKREKKVGFERVKSQNILINKNPPNRIKGISWQETPPS